MPNITELEYQLLSAMYAIRGLDSVTVPELKSAYPHSLKDRPEQGLHRSAASLVRKGLLARSSHHPTQAVAYRITEEGRDFLRARRRAKLFSR